MVIPYIALVGHANTGKTTLVSRLIQRFRKRGVRVAAVKHAPHGYDADVPGRDTWKYYQSGAEVVAAVGPDSLTLHQRLQVEPSLQEVLERIEGVDLIIVEGFKQEPGPKIEVLREGYSEGRLKLGSELVAVVGGSSGEPGVPCFSPDQVEELADFIARVILGGMKP